MKTLEICLGMVMLTLSVLNDNIITATELQVADRREWNFYFNNSKQTQKEKKKKMRPQTAVLPATHEFENNVCWKTTKLPFHACTYACVTNKW